MRVKVTADVHGDLDAVRNEAASCDRLLILGDLINMVDYHRGDGVLADVYGRRAVQAWAKLRSQGRFDQARAALTESSAGREDEMREQFRVHVEKAHERFCASLPSNIILTYGNVDTPELIRKHLPPGVRFADAEVIEVDGVRFGFVGGGLPKSGIPGEVSVDAYQAKVASLGPVDVLCSHAPPAVEDLAYDTVAGIREPGSDALLEYVRLHRPSHLYFGHVHQPRAFKLDVDGTRMVNVGCYFRKTRTAVCHPV